MSSPWPQSIYLVRHAESIGNVASIRARLQARDTIEVAADDRSVPLTTRGEEQARALGVWFRGNPPTVVWSSPHLRATETARIMSAEWTARVEPIVDERLRERSLGVLNRLTASGIRERYPQEVVRRAQEGKFRYRPPNGESWYDVTRRLADVVAGLHTLPAQRVLIVTHQAIVFCLRFLLEQLSVAELLAIDARTDLANCSLTEYEGRSGTLALTRFNDTEPLRALSATITKGNDAAGTV